jgi:hypothetical protein
MGSRYERRVGPCLQDTSSVRPRVSSALLHALRVKSSAARGVRCGASLLVVGCACRTSGACVHHVQLIGCFHAQCVHGLLLRNQLPSGLGRRGGQDVSSDRGKRVLHQRWPRQWHVEAQPLWRTLESRRGEQGRGTGVRRRRRRQHRRHHPSHRRPQTAATHRQHVRLESRGG